MSGREEEGGDKRGVFAVTVCETTSDACKRVAEEIATTIKEKVAQNGRCVLGLATGATQIPVYQELVRLHKVLTPSPSLPLDQIPWILCSHHCLC